MLAVVLMVALVAVPAFASVQNVKISGDVDTTYLFRDNFDLGQSTGLNLEDTSQHLFFTQTRLRVDADLTDQVSATVALINERVWEADPGDRSDVSLNLAYVTLREMLYSPLTVIVGRQVFSYGNSLVMDATGANNLSPTDSTLDNIAEDMTKQTALDAIRLVFDYNPLTLELLYSKVDTGTAGASADVVTDDVDLYGANATYELGDDLNTQIEAYFFARIDKSTNANGDFGSKSDTIYLPGLRASADVLDGLNIQGEIAWQRGNRVASTDAVANDNEQRDAMAAQVISNYQIPNDILPDVLEEYNPAVKYIYTYVSGDSNPEDISSEDVAGPQASANRHTAWDPFFENQHGGTIYNSLFDLTNAHIHAVSLTANPIEDVTTTVTWTGLWLDKQIDDGASSDSVWDLRQPGTVLGLLEADVNRSTEIGYEIDIETTYDYTEDVQIGASMGWFIPGDVFLGVDGTSGAQTPGNDSIASQAMVHGIVNF